MKSQNDSMREAIADWLIDEGIEPRHGESTYDQAGRLFAALDLSNGWGEFEKLHRALGDTTRFLDLPDGGDVSPEEQARRLRQALEDAEQQVIILRQALRPFAKLKTSREAQDPAEGTMRVRVVTVSSIEAARDAIAEVSRKSGFEIQEASQTP